MQISTLKLPPFPPDPKCIRNLFPALGRGRFEDYLFINASVQSSQHVHSSIFSLLSNTSEGKIPGVKYSDAKFYPHRDALCL